MEKSLTKGIVSDCSKNNILKAIQIREELKDFDSKILARSIEMRKKYNKAIEEVREKLKFDDTILKINNIKTSIFLSDLFRIYYFVNMDMWNVYKVEALDNYEPKKDYFIHRYRLFGTEENECIEQSIKIPYNELDDDKFVKQLISDIENKYNKKLESIVNQAIKKVRNSRKKY